MSTTTVQADVTTEPERIAFKPGSYDGKPQRVIDYRWPVGEPGPNGERVFVELGCWHNRDRKAYTALVNNVQMTPREGYTSVESLPMSAKHVLSDRCARYSKANFELFAAAALSHFRELVEAGEFGEHLRGEHSPLGRFGS
jgi:hypothetical protein